MKVEGYGGREYVCSFCWSSRIEELAQAVEWCDMKGEIMNKNKKKVKEENEDWKVWEGRTENSEAWKMAHFHPENL